jgi:hypothetical protein
LGVTLLIMFCKTCSGKSYKNFCGRNLRIFVIS